MRRLSLFFLVSFLVLCVGNDNPAAADNPAASTVPNPQPAAGQPVENPVPTTPEPDPELVDLNTATVSQLKSLPWIGDIYSKAIIEGRPYASKEDFASKRIIPSVTYEKLKDLITVTDR